MRFKFLLPAVFLAGCSTPSILLTKELQMGDLCMNEYQYEEAHIHYQTCVNASKQLGVYRNLEKEAEIYRKLAHTLVVRGQYSPALPPLDSAWLLDSVYQNLPGCIEDLREKGYVYLYLGALKSGIHFLENSLELAKGMENSLKENQQKNFAETNLALLQACVSSGQFTQGIQYGDQALRLFRQMDDKSGSAACLYHLAILHMDAGNIDMARKMLDESTIKAKEAQLNPFAQTILAGELERQMGNLDESLKLSLQGMEEAKKTGIIPQIIWSYISVGDAYTSLGDMENAFHYFLLASQLHEESSLEKNPLQASIDMRTGNLSEASVIFRSSGNTGGEAIALMKMGDLWLENNLPDSALMYYENAENFFKKIHNKEGALTALLKKISSASLEEENEKMKSLLIQVLQKSVNPELHWQVWYQMGMRHEWQDSLSEAEKDYREAIRIIESVRSGIAGEEWRSTYLEKRMDVYERLILLLLKKNKTEEAFLCSEQARSRSFLDMISNARIGIKPNADKELAEQELSLNNRMIQLRKHLIALYSGEEISTGFRSSIQETDLELETLQQQYQQVVQRIKIQQPEYYSLIETEPAQLSAIYDKLNQEQAILSYWIGKEKLIIWLLRKNSIQCKIQLINDSDLRTLIEESREALSSGLSTGFESFSKLYSFLIQPFENELQKYPSILIIPHRELHFLPFQVLRNSQQEYLLSRFIIRYIPSANVFVNLSKREFTKGSDLLAMGLGNQMIGISPPLPGTMKELEFLKKLYPDAVVKGEKELSEDFFKKEATRFAIIHLATHGYFNESQPLFSFLLMNPSENEDGELTVNEIFNQELHAQLVTLSACQTGLGKLGLGDEITGLSRAFIYAGTPYIIVSLWSVADDPTAQLMESFYRMLGNLSIPVALTQAQRELLKKYPSPFYWAPFILIGSN